MAKAGKNNVKPWCPFCGIDVGRASDAVQRKMTEFPLGSCDCGAVYVCDATGHNVGSAMVECLVYACKEEWDLAWELMPEDDYLTGRVDNYDEVTHQVVPTRELDGRWVRGVLYFVRLHKDIAEIAERVQNKQISVANVEAEKSNASLSMEPERDPKRKKKRADKNKVKELASSGDIDALVDLCFDDRRTLRFLLRLLYDPDQAGRYHTAWVIGQVCGRLSSREPGPVADLLHTLFDTCTDSAATNWGMIETIGSVIASRPDIYGAFTRHLMNFVGGETTQEHAIWSLGEIAETRPDLVRKTPFYSTFHFLGHEDPLIRGLMVRLMGRIKATEAVFQVMGLQSDEHEITIYEKGQPVQITVAQLANQAVELIQNT
jgi:hypothetical protein